MIRNRGYYRNMRAKHIRRKKKLTFNFGTGWGYEHDGMYSKGKNRLKHGNYHSSKDWKHSDLQKIQKMDSQLREYIA